MEPGTHSTPPGSETASVAPTDGNPATPNAQLLQFNAAVKRPSGTSPATPLAVNAAIRKEINDTFPGALTRMMSQPDTVSPTSTETLDTAPKLKSNMAEVTCTSTQHKRRNKLLSLVDRGCNGGLAGSDIHAISQTDRRVDVTGVDDHEINDLRIGTVGAVTKSNHGLVIGIFHQCAITPNAGKTIHSSGQMEWHKNQVHDESVRVGGFQCVITPDGHMITLDILGGLPHMALRPCTDHEWETLPHVIFASDARWDPSVLDNAISDTDNWFEGVRDLNANRTHNPFTLDGKCRHRHPTAPDLLEANHFLHINLHELRNICLLYTSPSPRDLSTSRMPSSA